VVVMTRVLGQRRLGPGAAALRGEPVDVLDNE
jgi:hypothetical protein